MDAQIRAMTFDDLDPVNEIYNYYVLNSTCTYQLTPETRDAREEWYRAHGEEYPLIVAEHAGQIAAWGSLSRFHSRCGYKHTVENSVYIRHDLQRHGIGGAILADLIRQARTLGHRTIIADIDAEQEGSVVLHSRFGFAKVGHLRQAGYKFERWLDVVYMQLLLGE